MVIVRTPTVEDYIEVVRQAIDKGLCWQSKTKLIYKHYWERHESLTCIIIDDDELISCCSIKYAAKFPDAEILSPEQSINKYFINMFGKKFDLR